MTSACDLPIAILLWGCVVVLLVVGPILAWRVASLAPRVSVVYSVCAPEHGGTR